MEHFQHVDHPSLSQLARSVFAAERVYGNFERSVRLPEFVDADRIEARFTNGLLVVTVPKAPTAQARKIAIKS